MIHRPTSRRPAGPTRRPWLWHLALALAAAGCNGLGGPKGPHGQLRQFRQDNEKLRGQVARLEQDLRARDDHIRDLQALGDKRLEKLFHVADIKLGRTGGLDLDKAAGDDAVRVYIKPIDRDGHAIKAAGAATVQLFDLAAAPQKNLLVEYKFSVDEMAKHWSASFMTYHYRLDCPWKSGPPSNPDLTVRVTFHDYLTGKTFTAQKLITVALPASASPEE